MPVPYRAATLHDWCLKNRKPYVQIAAHRRAEKRLRAIPGYKDNTYSFAHIESPAIFCGLVSDARLIPETGFVCTPDGDLLRQQMTQTDEIPRAAKERFILGKDSQDRYLIELGPTAAAISEPCVFVGGNTNFGHFIIESLMRVMVLEWLPAAKSLPIVVYDDLPRRFCELLDLVGYPKDRRIAIPRAAPPLFKQAWFVSAPMNRAFAASTPQLWLDGVWALRTRVAGLFKPSLGRRPRYFIPRGAVEWRRLVNENGARFRSLLEKFGVTAIQLHELSAAAQIAAVSDAALIVAAQGAGGQITTFAPPDCAVIELVSPDVSAIFGPQGTALMLDQPFARIVGKFAEASDISEAGLTPNHSPHLRDRDFVADLDELEKALAAADAYCNR